MLKLAVQAARHESVSSLGCCGDGSDYRAQRLREARHQATSIRKGLKQLCMADHMCWRLCISHRMELQIFKRVKRVLLQIAFTPHISKIRCIMSALECAAGQTCTAKCLIHCGLQNACLYQTNHTRLCMAELMQAACARKARTL